MVRDCADCFFGHASWDLRAKPSAPATQFQHGRSLVTGLDLLDPNRLASTSADGTICLWDIRGEHLKEDGCTLDRDDDVYSGGCLAVREKACRRR